MSHVRRAAWRIGTMLLAGMLALTLAAPAPRAQGTESGHQDSMQDTALGEQGMMFNQAGLVRGLLPAVVNITARAEIGQAPPETPNTAAADPQQRLSLRVNAGSGFVVRSDGVIVTNWHVVDSAFDITVTFFDGTRAKAEVLNAARLIDIAILKVDVGHKLPTAEWGDSSKVEIGDPVLAIGNPLGVGLSVTAGIISALNRNLMDTPYDDFIQTDAPINHGNSGGPLFDLHGKVIGMNTALISPTTGSAGLGFAIPSNDVHFIVERLLAYGWVRPAWLGVKIQLVTPDMATAMGLSTPEGSIVAWVVDGGPAERAGMKIGDVILRFGNTVPTDDRDLLRLIATSAPGRKVTLTLLRGGKQVELPVTLAEWPRMQWEQRDAPTTVAEPHWTIPHNLGISVQVPSPEFVKKISLPASAADMPAVQITSIQQNTEALRQGLAVGDLILRVDDIPIDSAATLQKQIDAARAAHRPYALFLIFPKNAAAKGSKFPGPKWIALRVSVDGGGVR